MKKSQILAALALAFALGVVAPVAVAYNSNNVSAITTIDETTMGQDIEKVKGQPIYKTFKKFIDDLAKYPASDDVDATKEISAIVAKVGPLTAGGTYTAPTGATLQEVIDIAKGDRKDDANFVIDAETYDAYAALYEAINSPNVSLGTLEQKVAGINAKLAAADKFNWQTTIVDANITTAPAAISAITSGAGALHGWANYSGLIGVIKGTEAKIAKVEEGITALKSDYLDLYNNGYANPTAPATEDTLKSDLTNPATPLTLTTLQGKTGTVKRFANWQALVTDAEGLTVSSIESVRVADYNDLEQKLQAAYGNADLTIADLPAAPVNPVDPEKPGEGDDNNQDGEGDGKGDGATTPDTGVIANSEATATSTASIMAGIATALTAAGVGVVAFRNIRRNKKA